MASCRRGGWEGRKRVYGAGRHFRSQKGTVLTKQFNICYGPEDENIMEKGRKCWLPACFPVIRIFCILWNQGLYSPTILKNILCLSLKDL